MDYLSTALGIKVNYQKWQYESRLSYFIKGKYNVQLVFLEDTRALFLYPQSALDQIVEIKKQIYAIQRLEYLPVVLVLDKITKHKRDALIQARISFVIKEKQIYLPFMAVLLQERFNTEEMEVKKLQPSTQALFLYYIYRNQYRLYTNEAVKVLGFSAMTISRAAKELEATGQFYLEKQGVQIVLTSDLLGRNLFHQIKMFLINPVTRAGYISINDIKPEMLISGYHALAEQSMLNTPAVKCYAISTKNSKNMRSTTELFDTDQQVRLEVWKYDPQILSRRGGCVDPLSLAIALRNDVDERVEEAIDEMLNSLWRNLDGKRFK